MGTPILTQSIPEWCAALGAILKDKTLSPEDRAEIEGVKKAMEGMGFKNQGIEAKGGGRKMNLRDQKAHILRTIDGLLMVAPETSGGDFPSLRGVKCSDEYGVKMAFYKKQNTVSTSAPGGPQYKILNHKLALFNFKKRMRSYPTGPPRRRITGRRPSIKSVNNRVTGFSGEYKSVYAPRKATKLIEMPEDRTSAGFYGYGCFSNSFYIIRVPKPKTKRPLIDPPEPMEDMVNMDIGELTPAIFGKEKYHNPSGDFIDEKLRLEVLGFCGVEICVNPRYVDLILKHHPESKPYLYEGRLYMMMGAEVSGVVMGLRNGA